MTVDELKARRKELLAQKKELCDGGSEALQRRMRAQLNYVENTAFVLILHGH